MEPALVKEAALPDIGPPENTDPDLLARALHAGAILSELDQALETGRVAYCRLCNTVLPDDAPCPGAPDGQHDPDKACPST